MTVRSSVEVRSFRTADLARLCPDSVPSRTALAAANLRAIHQAVDSPTIFDDPLADKFLDGYPKQNELLGRRAMRAFVCARARFSEDVLAAAYERGVRQYVLLGAGLDTFAWRNPYPDLRVFELDHPATQIWKRQRADPLPRGLVFSAIDFRCQAVFEVLHDAGMIMTESTMVAWLGVTPYLTTAVFDNVLRSISSITGDVEIVFDYDVSPSALPSLLRAAYERRAAGVAMAGEPWLSRYDPADLALLMSKFGFSHVEDFGPAELNARYLSGRADSLRILAGRVMHARRCPGLKILARPFGVGRAGK